MAAKFNSMAAAVLALLYQAVTWAGIAQNNSTPLTSIYISLNTAAPSASSDQTSSEAAYTGYGRASVARTTSGFTLTGESISPAANISFATATGGSETETYATTGSVASGAGQAFHYGQISPSIAVSSGVTPILGTGTTITES